MWSGLYNALLFAAALLAVPYYGAKMLLTGKYRKSLGPKFGRRLPGDRLRWREARGSGSMPSPSAR